MHNLAGFQGVRLKPGKRTAAGLNDDSIPEEDKPEDKLGDKLYDHEDIFPSENNSSYTHTKSSR